MCSKNSQGHQKQGSLVISQNLQILAANQVYLQTALPNNNDKYLPALFPYFCWGCYRGHQELGQGWTMTRYHCDSYRSPCHLSLQQWSIFRGCLSPFLDLPPSCWRRSKCGEAPLPRGPPGQISTTRPPSWCKPSEEGSLRRWWTEWWGRGGRSNSQTRWPENVRIYMEVLMFCANTSKKNSLKKFVA